jgi:hypothetical protein
MFERLFQTTPEQAPAAVAAAVRSVSPRGFPCVKFADLHDVARGAPFIEERIDPDQPPPRVITRFAAKAFDRAESLQPDFLREVFGTVSVARVMEGQHAEALLAGAGERGEGFHVACLRAPDNSLSLYSLNSWFALPTKCTDAIDTAREIWLAASLRAEIEIYARR